MNLQEIERKREREKRERGAYFLQKPSEVQTYNDKSFIIKYVFSKVPVNQTRISVWTVETQVDRKIRV